MDDINQSNPHINVNVEEEQEPKQRHDITADEQTWGMLAHLAGLSGFIIPFGSLIGPFLVWQIKGKDSAYVEEQAKEAFNFQLSLTIYIIVSAILCAILIGIPMLIFFAIAGLVLTIIGAVKANDGILYKYKFNMNLVK